MRILFLLFICISSQAQKVNFWAQNKHALYVLSTDVFYKNEGGSQYTSAALACAMVSPLGVSCNYNGSFINSTYIYASPTGTVFSTYGLTISGTYFNDGLGNSYQLASGTGGNYYITNLATCSGSAPYYTNSTGTYPTNGSSGTSSSGTIYNYSGVTIYVYAVYNSAGATSGAASSDCYWSTFENIGGTITGSSQIFRSTNYATVTNGSTRGTSLTKNDVVGTGAGVRWAYSLTIGGTLINL